MLPHLLCAIGVVKRGILPENAQVLSRYISKIYRKVTKVVQLFAFYFPFSFVIE